MIGDEPDSINLKIIVEIIVFIENHYGDFILACWNVDFPLGLLADIGTVVLLAVFSVDGGE